MHGRFHKLTLSRCLTGYLWFGIIGTEFQIRDVGVAGCFQQTNKQTKTLHIDSVVFIHERAEKCLRRHPTTSADSLQRELGVVSLD